MSHCGHVLIENVFLKQREVTRECPAEVLLRNKMRIVGLALNSICFSHSFLGCVGFFNFFFFFFPFYHPVLLKKLVLVTGHLLTQRWALLVALLF